MLTPCILVFTYYIENLHYPNLEYTNKHLLALHSTMYTIESLKTQLVDCVLIKDSSCLFISIFQLCSLKRQPFPRLNLAFTRIAYLFSE